MTGDACPGASGISGWFCTCLLENFVEVNNRIRENPSRRHFAPRRADDLRAAPVLAPQDLYYGGNGDRRDADDADALQCLWRRVRMEWDGIFWSSGATHSTATF